ncbi:MAG: hypothetical protein WA324_13340, partial [Bryobacteraceae bacterium]
RNNAPTLEATTNVAIPVDTVTDSRNGLRSPQPVPALDTAGIIKVDRSTNLHRILAAVVAATMLRNDIRLRRPSITARPRNGTALRSNTTARHRNITARPATAHRITVHHRSITAPLRAVAEVVRMAAAVPIPVAAGRAVVDRMEAGRTIANKRRIDFFRGTIFPQPLRLS